MKMMKMKNKLLFVPIVLVIIFMLGVTNSTTTRRTTTTTTAWTTGHSGLNLKGKMFTLSSNGRGISFYSPSFSPPSSTPSYTTHRYITTTYAPWTTASPYNGLSVCLRFITDKWQTRGFVITLSPSRNPLYLTVTDSTTYSLSASYTYNSLYFATSIRFWPDIRSDIWTRVCLTMDFSKNVAQVFSGPNMSIRKVLPFQYVWSGEPVINFPGFDGQVTDVQVWDYPLRYGEVYNYMNRGVYGQYRGSVLSWSYISYSTRGNVLLEDIYEWQDKQPIIRKGRGRQLKEEGNTKESFKETQQH